MNGTSNPSEQAKSKGDKGAPENRLPRQILEDVWRDLQRLGILGNLAVGVILLLVGPIVLYMIQGFRGAVIAAGVGLTLAIWLLVAVVLKHASSADVPESELQGVLIPANDPIPPNPCPEQPRPGTIAIYIGSSVGYTSAANPYGVLKLDDDVVLSIEKSDDDGLLLNATVRSPDKRIVATIEKNVFHVNPNNYFYIKRPDRHTLIVRDQQNRECLNVRFLNPSAVRVLGVFEFATGNFPGIIINETEVLSIEKSVFRNQCLGESEGAFWIESRPAPPRMPPPRPEPTKRN